MQTAVGRMPHHGSPLKRLFEIFVPRNVGMVCKVENSKRIGITPLSGSVGGRGSRLSGSSPWLKEDQQGVPRALRGVIYTSVFHFILSLSLSYQGLPSFC